MSVPWHRVHSFFFTEKVDSLKNKCYLCIGFSGNVCGCVISSKNTSKPFDRIDWVFKNSRKICIMKQNLTIENVIIEARAFCIAQFLMPYNGD